MDPRQSFICYNMEDQVILHFKKNIAEDIFFGANSACIPIVIQSFYLIYRYQVIL